MRINIDVDRCTGDLLRTASACPTTAILLKDERTGEPISP